MYAQQINGEWTELRGNIVFSPTVFQTAESLSAEQRSEFGVYLIADMPLPTLQTHEKYSDPIYALNGQVLERSYTAIPKTAEELEADKQALISGVMEQTQQRLDTFAKTRNYDGILSACTYATSTVPKFKAEGQYCVEARDATWAKLYQIMAEVEAGTRPMPSGFDDVAVELPMLVWPV